MEYSNSIYQKTIREYLLHLLKKLLFAQFLKYF